MSEGLHPGVHPDPDALNAFVEGALAEHERVGCLAHLAEWQRYVLPELHRKEGEK